jgi:fructose/tagatose bisphosphate aldolase
MSEIGRREVVMGNKTAEIASNRLNNSISLNANTVVVEDEDALRQAMDSLVHDAVFGDQESRRISASLIWETGLSLGIRSASIHELYMAAGRGEYRGITVPAINIRGLTYDVARSIFRSAIRNRVGAFIFEIARSEIGYTDQRPLEYATVVLGAAIKEGYRGPVFIQGDHFQLKAAKYEEDPKKEVAAIRNLIREAIEAGFYNIDIDASTLVDISKKSISEQQHLNYSLSAQLTSYIRQLEPKGITVSVGGEIGEVGGKNSTVEELEAYLDNYRTALDELGNDTVGLSKVSVQTGTSHGGVVLPDGNIAKVKIDFQTLAELSRLAREKYGLGGAVQHGASTLPDEAFHHFPDMGTCEVHLATGFQNMIYDHPRLPGDFRDRIYKYLFDNSIDERKEGQSDTQFLYKTRKKAFGPFKDAWWNLNEEIREQISKDLEDRFTFLFKQLNVINTNELVEEKISMAPVHKEMQL